MNEGTVKVPMTTRWTEADHKLISDTAWCKRMSVSKYVRKLVLEGLRREGLVPQEATTTATGDNH
jgi:hypothetical protein